MSEIEPWSVSLWRLVKGFLAPLDGSSLEGSTLLLLGPCEELNADGLVFERPSALDTGEDRIVASG